MIPNNIQTPESLTLEIETASLYKETVNRLNIQIIDLFNMALMNRDAGFDVGDGTYCLYNYRIEELRNLANKYPSWYLQFLQNASSQIIQNLFNLLFVKDNGKSNIESDLGSTPGGNRFIKSKPQCLDDEAKQISGEASKALQQYRDAFTKSLQTTVQHRDKI